VLVFKDFISTLAPWNVHPAQYFAIVLMGANLGRSRRYQGSRPTGEHG